MNGSIYRRIGWAGIGIALAVLPTAFAATATGKPEQAYAAAQVFSNHQVEALQAQLRDLLAQLDEIEELHADRERRSLMNRHWQAVQDYLRQLRQLQPMAVADAGSFGTYGSAACRLAVSMDTDRYVSQMRDLLWDMREKLADIHQSGDSVQRAQALRALSRRTYQVLQNIRGFGWMYGSAAPIREDNPSMPDSASEPAYLVRHYCGQCHAPPPPDLHSANEWSTVASKMERHMGIAVADDPQQIERPKPHELTLIVTYLEDYGCEPVE